MAKADSEWLFPGIRYAILVAAVVLITAVIGRVEAAGSGTLTVSNGNDSGPGSLRQAVADAGNNDKIVIDFANPVIKLLSPITIGDKLIIETKSSRSTAIVQPANTPGTSRFIVNNGILTLRRMQFRSGIANGSSAVDRIGGAILNYGTLNMSDVSFNNNRAQDFGGAVANYGKIIADNVQASGNEAVAGCGGFAWNFGHGSSAIKPVELTVEQGQIVDNTTAGGGGGFCNMAQAGGEAILKLNSVYAEGNSANTGGFIANDTDASGRAAVEMNIVTAEGNAAAFGGMLSNGGPGGAAILTNVTATENEASSEGTAVASANGAETTIRYSTFAGNQAVPTRNTPAQDLAPFHTFNVGRIKFIGSLARHLNGDECNGDGIFEDGGGNVFEDNTCYVHNPEKSLVDAFFKLSPLQDNGGDVPTMFPGFSFGIPNLIGDGQFLCGTEMTAGANGQAAPVYFLGANFCFPGAVQPPSNELIIEKKVPEAPLFDTQFGWAVKAHDPIGWVTVGNDVTKIDVPAGEVVLIEEKEKDWVIKSVSCTKPPGGSVNHAIEEIDDRYEIRFDHDGKRPVTCKIENSLKNRITVTKKSSRPFAGKWYFELNPLAPPGSSGLTQSLERDQSWTVENLPSGDYEIVEAKRQGWVLLSVDCQGADSELHNKEGAPGVIVHVEEKTRHDVECVFYNSHESDVWQVFFGPVFKPASAPGPK